MEELKPVPPRLGLASDPDIGNQAFHLVWMISWGWVVTFRLAGIATAILTDALYTRRHLTPGGNILYLAFPVALGAVSILHAWLVRPGNWPFSNAAHFLEVLLSALFVFMTIIEPLPGAICLIGLPATLLSEHGRAFSAADLRADRNRFQIQGIAFPIGVFALVLLGPLFVLIHYTRITIMLGVASTAAILVGASWYLWYRIWWSYLPEVLDHVREATEGGQTRPERALDSLLHNGLLPILEGIRVGIAPTELDRNTASDLIVTVRSGLLSTALPTSISAIITAATEATERIGLHLHTSEHVDGSPPLNVVEVVGNALLYLIANLRDAGASTVQLALDATVKSLQVVLRDDGKGFQPDEAAWSVMTQKHVIDALSAISAEASVLSGTGRGTTWTLRWPGDA